MAKGKKKGKKKGQKFPRSNQNQITYNKYKPNRQARRLGIEPEEPPKEEPRENTAAVLSRKVQQAQEKQKRIVPQGMTYGEYMEYLQRKRQQLAEKMGKG